MIKNKTLLITTIILLSSLSVFITEIGIYKGWTGFVYWKEGGVFVRLKFCILVTVIIYLLISEKERLKIATFGILFGFLSFVCTFFLEAFIISFEDYLLLPISYLTSVGLFYLLPFLRKTRCYPK